MYRSEVTWKHSERCDVSTERNSDLQYSLKDGRDVCVRVKKPRGERHWKASTQIVTRSIHTHTHDRGRFLSTCRKNAWFEASAAKQMRTALFWVVTQNFFSHGTSSLFRAALTTTLQLSQILSSTLLDATSSAPTVPPYLGSLFFWGGEVNLEDGTDRLSRNVRKNLPLLSALV
jgi:hypothetical protein